MYKLTIKINLTSEDNLVHQDVTLEGKFTFLNAAIRYINGLLKMLKIEGFNQI